MAPTVQMTARIFEDPIPAENPRHKRAPSVGDVLRGRRKENSPKKNNPSPDRRHVNPSPLGERHINSPPQPKKIPLKVEGTSRPPMHKKTSSATSLKGFLMGRDKIVAEPLPLERTPGSSPKKTKSATNLVGLLRKRSKKNLQETEKHRDLESGSSSEPGAGQYCSAQQENQNQYLKNDARDMRERRTVEEEIMLYTPKDYSEYRPAEQRNFYGIADPSRDFAAPQRPFLEHKSSRSSIFTEDLEEDQQGLSMQQPLNHAEMQGQLFSLPKTAHTPVESEEGQISPTKPDENGKRSSRILNTIAALKMRSRQAESPVSTQEPNVSLSPQELDSAMEQMLGRYDVPQNLRDQLRNLKPEVKAGLMKGDRIGSGSSEQSVHEGDRGRKADTDRTGSKDEDEKHSRTSRSHSRTRSRILSISKRNDSSPAKKDTSGRSRSKSRPKSIDIGRMPAGKGMSSSSSLHSLNAPDSATTPGDFIHYLKEVQKPELVEVGKLHKLRILLRNESVTWTDAFVKKGGLDEVIQLVYRIMKIEWREEHEDSLLHETLLCLKGLSTTKLAMQRLTEVGSDLFPALLKMLFDPERKGPAEYSTRGVIISLIFSYLSSTLSSDTKHHQERAHQILFMMQDHSPADDKQPLDFVSQMHTSRPYRTWCKEVSNVTKEVFWIFLHHMNVVPIMEMAADETSTFAQTYFPSLRAPHPAAPYVGGVEWEATQYLALHLDLLNGLIVSLPTVHERNGLREDLRQSGWEKVMGISLRTCKEKFYGAVHDGLKSWVAAAKKDGWYLEDVRAGPPRETASGVKSPVKKPGDEPPKLCLQAAGPALTKSTEDWL